MLYGKQLRKKLNIAFFAYFILYGILILVRLAQSGQSEGTLLLVGVVIGGFLAIYGIALVATNIITRRRQQNPPAAPVKRSSLRR